MIDWDSCVLWLDSRYFSESYWWDRSKYNNDGVVYGAKWEEDGFYFYDNYINCGNKPSLPENTPFTLAVLIRFYKLDNNWRCITDKFKTLFYTTLSIWKTNDNKFSFTTGNGEWNDLKGRSITIGTLYFIIAAWDGSTKYIYINGELDNSSTPPEDGKPCSGAGNFNIGARDVTNYYLRNAKIYAVYVFDKFLKEKEIKILTRNVGV